uniref:Uncharacterized protein n=1 Tax=Salix viminalis TaxID=40686 RepID=A0A6N2L2K1_SALVM
MAHLVCSARKTAMNMTLMKQCCKLKQKVAATEATFSSAEAKIEDSNGHAINESTLFDALRFTKQAVIMGLGWDFLMICKMVAYTLQLLSRTCQYLHCLQTTSVDASDDGNHHHTAPLDSSSSPIPFLGVDYV